MTKDEQIDLILKKKELWMNGRNCFNEALRLQKDLYNYINSTNEIINKLNQNGKVYLDEMQKIAEELDNFELELDSRAT